MHIQLIGIPTFSGAEHSGTELAPDALRQAGLTQSLQQQGIRVTDLGNLKLPDFLPRHNLPPVRNWPAPRMIWETVSHAGHTWFTADNNPFTLLLGGDCSLIVGAADALHTLYGDQLHILVVDGHVDTIYPDPATCEGTAGMGLFFLLQNNQWWPKPANLDPSRVKVLGYHLPPATTLGIDTTSYADLRRHGLVESAQQTLAALPPDAKILLHFDVDVIHQGDMPSAYYPSPVGLFLSETQTLLSTLLSDPRIIALELTEYSPLRDPDGASAKALISLLTKAFTTRKTPNDSTTFPRK